MQERNTPDAFADPRDLPRVLIKIYYYSYLGKGKEKRKEVKKENKKVPIESESHKCF